MGQQDSKYVQTMENVLRAIEEIADAKMKSLSFDRTIKATIINADTAEKGTYLVAPIGAEQTTTFTAYSNDTTYKTNDYVYVTVPEGDMSSSTKLIVGKCVSSDETYYNYVNPLDNFLDTTGNLISGMAHMTWDLTANYEDKSYAVIWEATDLSLKGYDRLCIKGQFKTWLQSLDVFSGTYGLILTAEDSTGKIHKFNLTTNEMYGNPYYYDTFYLQEVLLDISKIDEITALYLTFVQCNDFYDSRGDYAPYLDDEGNRMPSNIFVKAPHISFGYDISNFDGDDLRIYTEDEQIFNSQMPSESRSIKAQWIHVGETTSAIVIDELDEMPRNPDYTDKNSGAELFPAPFTKSDLTWFEYQSGHMGTHPVAGAGWVEVSDEYLNQFTYTFNTPSGEETQGSANDLPSLKYKAIVSTPSIRYVNFSFTQTEEYQTAVDITSSDNVGLLQESIQILHNVMTGEILFSDGKKAIEEKYRGTTSIDKENLMTAFNVYSNMRSEIKWVESSELVFPNAGYAPGKYAKDAIADLAIVVDPEDLHGNYLIYDDNGLIIDTSQATKSRYCEAVYRTLAGVLNASETQSEDIAYDIDTAECVTWYIPLESTMIARPVEGSEYKAGEQVENIEVTLAKPEGDLPCGKYCKIVRIPQLDETIIDDDALIAEHQMFSRQHFKIKDYYTQLETNNSIYCRVTKGGTHRFAVGHLTFGTSGTNGTNSTFNIRMFEVDKNGNFKVDDNGEVEESQATTLSVKTTYYEIDRDGSTAGLQTKSGQIVLVPELFDYNNKPVQLTEDQVNKLTYKFYGRSDSEDIFHIEKKGDKGLAILSWKKNITTLNAQDDYYLVIEATIPYRITYNFAVYTKEMEEKKQIPEGKMVGDYILDEFGNKTLSDEKSTREDTLQTFLPISIVSHKILSKGVIVDSSKEPAVGAGEPAITDFKVYQQQIVGANKVLYDRNGSNAKYYKDPYKLYDGELKEVSGITWERHIECAKAGMSADDVRPIESFYPTISPDGVLEPLETYIMSGADPRYCVYGKNGDDIVCVQPVLIMQNRYGSPMMNKWDGSLTIDEKNGIILSSMVGAGIKDEHNTFSGVLMGEVSQAYPDNHNGLGIYGFHQNDQSFGFNVNGTAFIGKAGRGRIWFDGNNGTITSGTYSDGSEKYKDLITQKIRPQQGMKIDLDGSDGLSSSIHAFGARGGFVIDLAYKDEKYPFKFKVFNGNYGQQYDPKKDEDANDNYERGVICFDDSGEYIQSLNYDGAYHGGPGVNDNGDTIDLWIPPTGAEGQTFAPGADPENRIAKSAQNGMFIDLRNGWIDARNGIVGGWKLNKNSLTTMSQEIILWAGDPSSSDTNAKNGQIPNIQIGTMDKNGTMRGNFWIADYKISAKTNDSTIVSISAVRKDNMSLDGTSLDFGGSTTEDINALLYSAILPEDEEFEADGKGINEWYIVDDTSDYANGNIGLKLQTVISNTNNLIALTPNSNSNIGLLGTKTLPWDSSFIKSIFMYDSFKSYNGDPFNSWCYVASQPWVTSVVIPLIQDRMQQINGAYWSKTQNLLGNINALDGVGDIDFDDNGGTIKITAQKYSVQKNERSWGVTVKGPDKGNSATVASGQHSHVVSVTDGIITISSTVTGESSSTQSKITLSASDISYTEVSVAGALSDLGSKFTTLQSNLTTLSNRVTALESLSNS